MANEIERRRWNDEQQVKSWPKRERFTDRVVPNVVAALNPTPGEHVLDIGSGGGKLCLAIGARVGTKGKAVGADISSGMVAMATERATAANASNVTFLVADVQTETVPGGPFDAATSQFGVMFFDEPITAFTNIRRQLKPGGRIAFACWQSAARNTWHSGTVLARFVAPPPELPPGKSRSGPFSLGDPRKTRKLLSDAGFVGITRTSRRVVVVVPEDSIFDEQQMTGVNLLPERQAEARAALASHFAQFRRPDGLSRFELNFQIFTARNSSSMDAPGAQDPRSF